MKRCVICGKEFEPKVYNQLTCSATCSRKRGEEKTRQRNARNSSDVTKKCAQCGKEFIYSPRASAQRFCSVECRRKYERIRKRKTYVVPFRKCLECGREFTPSLLHPNQKFCSSECRAKYHNRPVYVGKPKAEPKPPKPPKPTKPLSEWIREARECNLDYGTYRALIERGKTFDELRAERDRHLTPAHAHCTYHYHK